MGGGIRDEVRAFEEVRALVKVSLLLTLDFLAKLWPASSSYSPVRLAERLI